MSVPAAVEGVGPEGGAAPFSIERETVGGPAAGVVQRA
jgi:hypothetical protein